MPENLTDTRKKIVDILKSKGPSLPIHISSQTGTSTLFAGALLSELAKDKILKISHMKVGGSPLYFLEGQERALENFHKHLPGKEKEAFLLLKKEKILEDKKQEPAIRVALRNLKDFAFPFSSDGEVFWRFYSTTEQEVRDMFNAGKKTQTKIQSKQKTETKKLDEKQLDIGLKPAPIKTKPIKTGKKTKRKSRPEFATKISNILQNNRIEILDEKDVKKKEYSAVVRINSTLGPIRFLGLSKDKKKITENDLRLALQRSQAMKMPALVLITGEINKKALAYAEKWSSLLKLKKIQ